jgi:hypothetical protein
LGPSWVFPNPLERRASCDDVPCLERAMVSTQDLGISKGLGSSDHSSWERERHVAAAAEQRGNQTTYRTLGRTVCTPSQHTHKTYIRNSLCFLIAFIHEKDRSKGKTLIYFPTTCISLTTQMRIKRKTEIGGKESIYHNRQFISTIPYH